MTLGLSVKNHVFCGEPGDGVVDSVMMFEGFLELRDEVGESAKGDSGSGCGVLPESVCPSEGGAFGHVQEGKDDLLCVGVIDFVVNMEIKLDSVKSLNGSFVRTVEGFRGADTKLGKLGRKHGGG